MQECGRPWGRWALPFQMWFPLAVLGPPFSPASRTGGGGRGGGRYGAGVSEHLGLVATTSHFGFHKTIERCQRWGHGAHPLTDHTEAPRPLRGVPRDVVPSPDG